MNCGYRSPILVPMTGHIFIEGEIGTAVTAKSVRADIANYPGAEEFIVHINSPGGDVYEGYQIGSIIKNLGKKTTAQIGSMCASIATYDALCCDHVIMNTHGDFMIHLPTGRIEGTAEDLRRGAEQLDRIKSELIDRYMPRVARKGVTRAKLSEMIDAETSMTPTEAEALGFVDTVQEKMRAVALLDVSKFKNDDMDHKETKTMLEKLQAGMKTVFSALRRFKNMVEDTLEDGTPIVVMADPGAVWDGAQVTTADGAPLAPGSYKTKSGYTITVADGGVISTAVMEDKKDDSADKKDDKPMDNVDELKNKIAELEGQLAAKNAEAADASKAVAQMRTQFSNLSKEIEEMKKLTVGNDGPPTSGFRPKDMGDNFDPMGEDILKELKARGRV